MVTKVKTGVIADLAVGQQQLAADSVTAAKIVDGAVGQAEIGTDAVQADEIAAGAVGASEIGTDAVGLDELAAEATPVFTKQFTSSNQTITSAGALTLAHSLGGMPALVQVRLKCTTADNGYSVGDELVVNPGLSSNGGSEGVVVVPDATNLNIRYASAAGAFKVLNKGTGAAGPIVNGSWAAIFKAWA